MKMSKKKAEALVTRYQGSLLPSLGAASKGATLFNAVALSFFNPGISLGQALDGAEQLNEAVQIVKKGKTNGVHRKHRNGVRSSRIKTKRSTR
jgi:hypothetical protein